MRRTQRVAIVVVPPNAENRFYQCNPISDCGDVEEVDNTRAKIREELKLWTVF